MGAGPQIRRSTLPAFLCALLFIAGILIGDRWSVSPVPAFCAASAAFILVIVQSLIPAIRFLRGLTAVLLVASLGMVRIAYERAEAPVLADAVVGKPVTLIATIISPPQSHGGQIRCLVDTRAFLLPDGPVRARVRLSLTFIEGRKDSLRPGLRYGMTLALRGEADRPAPARNPGEFDMRRFYEANGLAGSFFVKGYGSLLVLDSSGGTWLMRTIVAPLHRWIECHIDRCVGGEEGEFLKGLLIGDRSGIPIGIQKDFAVAGVAHVLAVSGSNVAVVALVFLMAYDLVRLPRRFRVPVIASALVAYMLVTGSQPPVVRATIMALVLLAGEKLERSTNGYNLLGVSAIVILGSDGRQLFDVGFQLSFAAVLSLVHIVPRANEWMGCLPVHSRIARTGIALLKLCVVTLAATLGTVPLMANTFGTVSLVGLFANLVVVPATGASVVIGTAELALGAIVPWMGDAFGALNWVILRLTLASASLCARVPHASIGAYGLSLPATVAYVSAVGAIFHWGETRTVRALIIAFLFAMDLDLFLPPDVRLVKPPGLLRVTLIDAGQGDAILVEFPAGETLLVDGGPGPRVPMRGRIGSFRSSRGRGLAGLTRSS